MYFDMRFNIVTYSLQLSSELLDKIEGAMSSTSFEQVSKKLAKKLLRAGGR